MMPSNNDNYSSVMFFILSTLLLLQSSVVSLQQQQQQQQNNNNNNKHCGLKITTEVDRLKNRKSHKILIGHRGAPYHVPEHTIAGYRLALELGVDYIEPDLTATKDNVLVAYHSIDLNITTNVASISKFKDRYRTSHDDRGAGYWISDFTLDEIKELRVKQRYGDNTKNNNVQNRTTVYDNMFEIPTLQEIIDLLNEWNTQKYEEAKVASLKDEKSNNVEYYYHRTGLYAELKDPNWFLKEANINLVDLFLENLKGNEEFLRDDECSKIQTNEVYLVPKLVVQCFDVKTLEELYTKWKTYDFTNSENENSKEVETPNKAEKQQQELLFPPPPMVLLVDHEICNMGVEKMNEMLWYTILEKEYDRFLHGIGPSKDECMLPLVSAKHFQEQAHKHNLAVHVWTIRPESYFVNEYFTTQEEELNYLLCQVGVDGVFTEDIGTAAAMIQQPDCQSNTIFQKDKKKKKETDKNNNDDNNDSSSSSCNNNNNASSHKLNEESIYVALATGVMGLFLGILSTITVVTSKYCKSKRHTQRQLRIPTHEDIEMI